MLLEPLKKTDREINLIILVLFKYIIKSSYFKMSISVISGCYLSFPKCIYRFLFEVKILQIYIISEQGNWMLLQCKNNYKIFQEHKETSFSEQENPW